MNVGSNDKDCSNQLGKYLHIFLCTVEHNYCECCQNVVNKLRHLQSRPTKTRIQAGYCSDNMTVTILVLLLLTYLN